MDYKRYAVHWVEMDPARGSELRKTRPAVIVSLDALNRSLRTVVVCPFTTQLHVHWRTRFSLRFNGKPSEIAVDQIRAVDKERVKKKLGVLSPKDAASLRALLAEMYVE